LEYNKLLNYFHIKAFSSLLTTYHCHTEQLTLSS
jgi:hypothetical protein